MKKILVILTLFGFIGTSCEDYLTEDLRSKQTTETFYATVEGAEALVAGSYVTAKIWYGKEEGFDYSDVGTDVYTYAEQHPFQEQFLFSPSFNSNNGRVTLLWVEFYKGLNACNEAIFYLDDEAHPMAASTKIKRLAELHFLRAFYLWHLTETWGEIPMPLTPTLAPIVTATKSTIAEVYDQIFEDVNYAVDNLSDSDNTGDSNFGRVTKDAALAFRARLSLYAGNHIENENHLGLNDISTELYQQALQDAQTLIAGNYSFYDNYNDLWNLDNNSNNRNQEGIWAVNYSRNFTSMLNVEPEEYAGYFPAGQKAFDEREGGHHGHIMYGMRYEIFTGMERDIQYGRRFRRYMPNAYLIDSYNEDLDARYYGQFSSVWLGNLADSTRYPKWVDYDLPGGFTPPAGQVYIFAPGDTSIVATKKDINDARLARKKDGANRFIYVDGPYYMLDYDLQYNDDKTINLEGTDNRVFFYEISKFDDPDRPAANGTGSQNGKRDAYVFRLAEMYLIAAEAAWRTGVDGYPFLETLADSRTTDGVTGAQLLASYGINGNGDLDQDFFLDERAREFPGEQMRWFDLKRSFTPTGFVNRIKQYNFDTREHMDEHHYVRPIPQVQLDGITNKTEFTQNLGY